MARDAVNFIVSSTRSAKAGGATALTWCVLPQFSSAFNNTTLSKILHSITLANPPLPHIKGDYVWDPDMILDLFRHWPDNRNLSLIDLSRKTATLIMLCMARHQIDVVNLSLVHAQCGVREYVFILQHPSKTYKSAGLQGQTVRIKRFQEKKVCPYNAICHYIQRTSRIRKTQFLLITTMDHNPIAPATLSRWVKSVLTEAGVDVQVFKPHTTRAAAASKYAMNSRNLDETLKLGCWKGTSTFYQHYLRRPKYFKNGERFK